MIKGLTLILLVLLVGEALSRALGVPLPASVIGMLLVAVALDRRVVREETVRPAADTLTRHMGLFFVPAGASIVLYADVIRTAWLAILAASVISALLVFAVVGVIAQRLERSNG